MTEMKLALFFSLVCIKKELTVVKAKKKQYHRLPLMAHPFMPPDSYYNIKP